MEDTRDTSHDLNYTNQHLWSKWDPDCGPGLITKTSDQKGDLLVGARVRDTSQV